MKKIHKRQGRKELLRSPEVALEMVCTISFQLENSWGSEVNVMAQPPLYKLGK
jgi:hypothetical protein